MTKEYNQDQILKLHEEGIITGNNVPKSRLDQITKSIGEQKLRVWSDDDFDPDKEPSLHAGVSICYECGKMYWCTPVNDAYKKSSVDESGRVCELCLLKA